MLALFHKDKYITKPFQILIDQLKNKFGLKYHELRFPVHEAIMDSGIIGLVILLLQIK